MVVVGKQPVIKQPKAYLGHGCPVAGTSGFQLFIVRLAVIPNDSCVPMPFNNLSYLWRILSWYLKREER